MLYYSTDRKATKEGYEFRGGTLSGKRVKYITVCNKDSWEKGGHLYGKEQQEL